MWVWITLFLIVAGIGLIGVSQSTAVMIIGLVAFVTGVITMIFSMEMEEAKYYEETINSSNTLNHSCSCNQESC